MCKEQSRALTLRQPTGHMQLLAGNQQLTYIILPAAAAANLGPKVAPTDIYSLNLSCLAV